ncbi:MAG: C2H2-type zinc finger protein [Phycisphaerales bacterium]|nr:C2H2-type zinc finger protein [Phycisphaerales bacterium]
MAKNTYKCPKCDRSFMMAAHLGRHMTTMHGTVGKAAAKKKAGKAKTGKGKTGKKRGPKPGSRRGATRGRRPAMMSLKGGSLGNLARLVDDARAELQRRIRELESAI